MAFLRIFLGYYVSAAQLADIRLRTYYNTGDWHAVNNPGGLLADGHRVNYLPMIRDIGAISGASAAQTRLTTLYTEGDYHAVYLPGGFGNDGHRVNFVPSLNDVATVAAAGGLVSDARTRLASFYSSGDYHAIYTPGGMGRRGHLINFENALIDTVDVGAALANLV